MYKKFNLKFRIGWIYTKYQILTKVIFFFLLFPLYKQVVKGLITSTGRVGVSSGDYISFLFSLQGITLLLISLFFLAIVVGIDINAFIIMSALIKEKKLKLSVIKLLVVGIKSLKSFFKPLGLIIILYIALITPLVGIGLSISVTKNLKIPNFITDVIYNNNLYAILYFTLLIILIGFSIVHIFFLHYLIIEKESIKVSIKKSSELMRRHWKEFIREFFIKLAVFYILILGLTAFGFYLFTKNIDSIEDVFIRRLVTIFITISFTEIIGYMSIMMVPFVCYKLTNLFYNFNKKEGKEVKIKLDIKVESLDDNLSNRIKPIRKFMMILFLMLLITVNLIISALLGLFFNEIFKPNRKIEIVAHRAGGNLAAENSILGMKKAIELGASWSEIDVQRTKDGSYIINHDSSFKRLAGLNKSSDELYIKEIKKLKIKDLFNDGGPSQPVSTLDDFLKAAKGNIGLFIELKGNTADKKMVDDVVKMVKAKSMEKEVALLSLDYNLITYIEEKYPDIDTGYLYFFSIGDTQKLDADILIMEEEEATDKKIEEIHKANKKAIVWTVNSDESIKKFLSSDVDGIISDYVVKVNESIKERDKRSDIEIILDTIMN